MPRWARPSAARSLEGGGGELLEREAEHLTLRAEALEYPCEMRSSTERAGRDHDAVRVRLTAR
ncbi:hypothetical protein A7982_13650 [Minicystis rosea]|nr:hypothetical protein A7982_13650 [Minicystis rosea]